MFYKPYPQFPAFKGPAFEGLKHGSSHIHRKVHNFMGYWKALGILEGEAYIEQVAHWGQKQWSQLITDCTFRNLKPK